MTAIPGQRIRADVELQNDRTSPDRDADADLFLRSFSQSYVTQNTLIWPNIGPTTGMPASASSSCGPG